jgi:Rad52/22 family double-strand break repair protein.
MSKEVVKIEAKELSLVQDNSLNANQLALLMKRTPDKFVRTRPAKGGGTWTYVSGGYIRKVLNLMFGWDWDFEVLSEVVQANQVIVKGKLTCRVNGRAIVKTQFGCKEIMYKRGTQDPLNLGNDYKAAATDALKKCAADIGIASDIYGKDEFREISVNTESAEETHNTKEKERVTKHILQCTNEDELLQVYDLVGKYNLVTIYESKKELINANK